jgi:hypothetical protein
LSARKETRGFRGAAVADRPAGWYHRPSIHREKAAMSPRRHRMPAVLAAALDSLGGALRQGRRPRRRRHREQLRPQGHRRPADWAKLLAPPKK